MYMCLCIGPCSHTVQKLKLKDISAITTKTLKVIPERIIDNYNKRQQPRFKYVCWCTFTFYVCTFAFVGLWLWINVNHPFGSQTWSTRSGHFNSDPRAPAISGGQSQWHSDPWPREWPAPEGCGCGRRGDETTSVTGQRQKLPLYPLAHFYWTGLPACPSISMSAILHISILIWSFLSIPNVSSDAHSRSHLVCVLHNNSSRLPDCIYKVWQWWSGIRMCVISSRPLECADGAIKCYY